MSNSTGTPEENWDRFDVKLAWAKYLHLADLHRKHFYEWSGVDSPYYASEFLAHFSCWCSSLQVVVEGWKELKLTDPRIDALLEGEPNFVELLRRHRNGVFHFQPSIMPSKQTEFLRGGVPVIVWVDRLHDEFCRYYWEFTSSPPMPMSPTHLSEYQKSMRGLVGWVPEHLVEVMVENAKGLTRKSMEMLEISGDHSSIAAKELLEAIRLCDEAGEKAVLEVKKMRDQLFEQLKSRDLSPLRP